MDLNDLFRSLAVNEKHSQAGSTSNVRRMNRNGMKHHNRQGGGLSSGTVGFPADMTQLMSELMGSGFGGGDAFGGGGGLQSNKMFEEMMKIVGEPSPHKTGLLDSVEGHGLHHSSRDIFSKSQLHYGPRVDPRVDDWGRWTCVYPQYLDSELSVKQGRRVSRDYAVSHPQCYEIARAADRLGIKWIYENLGYARDSLTRGRIRFDIIDQSSGIPKFVDAPNKTVLLQRLCFEILLIREEDEQLHASVAAAVAARPSH